MKLLRHVCLTLPGSAHRHTGQSKGFGFVCVATEQLAAHVQTTSTCLFSRRHTGQSKGFGFVRMATEQLAAQALERLNLYMVRGKVKGTI